MHCIFHTCSLVTICYVLEIFLVIWVNAVSLCVFLGGEAAKHQAFAGGGDSDVQFTSRHEGHSARWAEFILLMHFFLPFHIFVWFKMNITLTRPFWDPLVNLILNRPEVLLLDGSSRDFASDGSFAVISGSRWRFCSGMRVSCFLLALSFEYSSGHWRVLGVTERLAFSGWQRVFPDALIACRSRAALGRNAIRSITYQMDPEREPPLSKLMHWNNCCCFDKSIIHAAGQCTHTTDNYWYFHIMIYEWFIHISGTESLLNETFERNSALVKLSSSMSPRVGHRPVTSLCTWQVFVTQALTWALPYSQRCLKSLQTLIRAFHTALIPRLPSF